MALFPMIAGHLFKRWQTGALWRQALLFAALIAAVDWIKSWIFTGFPWLTVGYSQAAPSPLAGFAPLIGVHGLSLLVALSGALLVRWQIGLPFAALLAASGFGLQQIAWTTPVGDPIHVALVQGNVPQEMKFRPEAFFRTLDLYREQITQNPAQLTVLPETAIPVFIDQIPAEFLDDLKALAKRQRGDIIFGTLTGDGEHYYNSAVSVGTSPLQVLQQEPSRALRRIHPGRLRLVHGLRPHSHVLLHAGAGNPDTAGRRRPARGRQHLLRRRVR
jgi:apolipoprotein N-acyltransferase